MKITDIIMPFGKGFAAVSVRKLMDDMAKKYTATIEKDMQVVAFKEKKDYFIYARVPSKTNDKYGSDKISYDVVLQLTAPTSTNEKNDEEIRNWDVKVFNNNPSFMFTFNYAYNDRRGLIRMPTGYYGSISLKQRPNVRNPMLLLGIDEDLWFTILFLDRNHWFERGIIDNICNGHANLNYKWLTEQITPQETKLKEVQDRSLRHRNEAKKAKEFEKLTKNEEERLKQQKKEESVKQGHARSSETILLDHNLRATEFNDLSSTLNSKNTNSAIKKNTLNKSRLGKSGLKSSL